MYYHELEKKIYEKVSKISKQTPHTEFDAGVIEGYIEALKIMREVK